MTRLIPTRFALVLLLVWVCAALAPPVARAQVEGPRLPARHSEEARRQAWLRHVHGSVQKDADRVAALVKELRAEADERPAEALGPGFFERLEALEEKVKELGEAVAAANENFLSLQAVGRAEEIKTECRALREFLSEKVRGVSTRKLRQLAREMEKRADSVADRIRLP